MRSAVDGVVREAIIAACLTAVMILVFLGSWRSTIIIAVSIPLSILCSLILLYALHETINIMTLGGMALAVGILVDDATVAIENINRYLETGKELEQAILDGSAQIATPALVSTLAICIVFVPMFLLSGVARYLFVPMAEAVVFAMLASYLLSRTLVPTMAKYLLQEHDDAETQRKHASRNPFVAFQLGFERGFERHAPRLPAPAHRLRRSRRRLHDPVPGLCRGLDWRTGSVARPGLLPRRRLRPVQDSRARAHRNAHRGDGRPLRPRGRDHPLPDSGQRTA